ncbi:MAG: hypothetical protein WCT18_04735 [Patescibacteria group bacterium]
MDEEIKKLLLKNIEETREIHEMVKKINRYIVWQQIFSITKVVLIVVPIIVAAVYALPFLRQAFQMYGQFTGMLGENNLNATNDVLKTIENLNLLK